MLINACASCASRRRSHCTCDPTPTGTPNASTSNTPPSVSPLRRISSMSAIMRASAVWSRHRNGDASMRSRSSGPTATSSAALTLPISITCERTWMPSAARNDLQTVPIATRAAVSRALARSRIGRASSNPNFCIPARSAWPGRGRVRAGSSARASSSPTAMICCHFGHSVLWTTSEIGEPMVRPWRMPPRISRRSSSSFILVPRP